MARHRFMQRARSHALALLLYTLGSLLATWPLAAHFTTHVTGDGIDDPALAWNLWWIKTRLVDQLNLDIFHSGWMFHPININLGFFTLTPLNGLLSVPLQSALSLTIANNLLLLLSFVLGGYGMWLLAQQVWGEHLRRFDRRVAWAIGWLTGAFFAFAGAKLFYASLGQFNIASSQWLPFCALYLWRTFHAQDQRRAAKAGTLAGLFLVFQAWAELTYATFLLLLFALTYLYFSVSWLLARPRQPQRWWQTTQGMLATAVVFVVGILPFLAAILPDLRVEGDFFASGGGFADIFSADLMGYLVPTRLHPWWGEWVAQLPFPNAKAQHIYLGYTLVLLIGVGVFSGLRHQRERTTTFFWLLALVFFWLLTLGPFVRWAGNALPIPGLFDLVSQLPFFNGNRYPSRYGVMLLLCAALLAARGLLWLFAFSSLYEYRTRTTIALSLVAALFAVEHISIPLPLNDFRIPSIYQRIAAEPGDFAVLELPTGWRNGARVLGKSDVLIMMQQWYQTAHGKRRLGGNTSRNPAYKFQYFSETPALADLIALMNADRSYLDATLVDEYPALVERFRKAMPELFTMLGIRYVTLHVEKAPELLVRFAEEELGLTLIEEWKGPDWTGAPSTIRLYRVGQLVVLSETTIDLSSAEAQMHLAEGWSLPTVAGTGRYATRPQVDMILPALAGGAQVTLTYGQPTRVTYHYQGQLLGSYEGRTHTLVLPSPADDPRRTEPAQRLTLTFEEPPTPIAALVPNATPIGNTGANLDPGIALLAQSAGEEVGDLAHLWINGVDYASGERGYNLVAMTTAGDVLDAATFDTMLQGESTRMAAWIDTWQEGTVIAGAAADLVDTEDVTGWDERLIAALQRIGVANDLRGKFRWSHAFIGVVGAPPASAVEEVSLIRPATVWLGVPLPAPVGYGPVLSIELNRGITSMPATTLQETDKQH